MAVPQYVHVDVGANYFVSGMIYDRHHRKMASLHYGCFDVSSDTPVSEQTITNITMTQALVIVYQLMSLQIALIVQ